MLSSKDFEYRHESTATSRHHTQCTLFTHTRKVSHFRVTMITSSIVISFFEPCSWILIYGKLKINMGNIEIFKHIFREQTVFPRRITHFHDSLTIFNSYFFVNIENSLQNSICCFKFVTKNTEVSGKTFSRQPLAEHVSQ